MQVHKLDVTDNFTRAGLRCSRVACVGREFSWANIGKHWFLGAIFHNGSFVHSARNGSDGTTRKSDSDTNFNSIHAKRTTVLVRSYRTLGLSLDSRYNFKRNFNQKYWLLFASWEHVTGMPSRFGVTLAKRRTKQPTSPTRFRHYARQVLITSQCFCTGIPLTTTGKYTSSSRTRFFRPVFLYVHIAVV